MCAFESIFQFGRLNRPFVCRKDFLRAFCEKQESRAVKYHAHVWVGVGSCDVCERGIDIVVLNDAFVRVDHYEGRA